MSRTSPEIALPPPRRIIADRYALEHSIGRGGMGEVFAAEHQWTKRRVALKLIRDDRRDDGHDIRRFLAEARAAASVSHPNVVEVLDMGCDIHTGAVYLVFELLEGRTLASVLAERTLSPTEIINWLVPIMDALQSVHEAGLVHRDVKPGNIFLAETSRGIVPKLLDFGIVKEGGLNRTTVGRVVGSPAYMSPEQARGEIVGPASDIWSMGAVLYECVSGYAPFEGESPLAVLAQVVKDVPPTLRRLAPRAPTRLTDAIDRALAKSTHRRHRTMDHFAEAVAQACEEVVEDESEIRQVSEVSGIRPSSRPVQWVGAIAVCAALCAALTLLAC